MIAKKFHQAVAATPVMVPVFVINKPFAKSWKYGGISPDARYEKRTYRHKIGEEFYMDRGGTLVHMNNKTIGYSPQFLTPGYLTFKGYRNLNQLKEIK